MVCVCVIVFGHICVLMVVLVFVSLLVLVGVFFVRSRQIMQAPLLNHHTRDIIELAANAIEKQLNMLGLKCLIFSMSQPVSLVIKLRTKN